MEGIDFDETFALIACLESIRLLMAFACTLHSKLYQMDVKSTFLNGYLNKEVFMAQPKLLKILLDHLDYLYKLKKPLYGLKQAPKAWYKKGYS